MGLLFLCLITPTMALAQPFFSQPVFLPPAKAFSFHAQIEQKHILVVRWVAAPGYHLYRDRIHLEVTPDTVHLASYTLPPGKWMNIPGVGRLQVYERTTALHIPLHWVGTPPAHFAVSSSYQGCANAGVCYPLATTTIPLALTQSAASALSLSPASPTVSAPPAPSTQGLNTMQPPVPASAGATALFATGLQGDGSIWILLLFFAAGLGLAFTPCIFPMIPILSSLVVGQVDSTSARHARRRHAFWISLAYVLGMAITYTVMGVLAAVTGAYLQAVFQNPWVLGLFSAIFVVLALSMFGFYELQVPSAVQTRLSRYGKGGHFLGAWIMGMLSALIVGPCIAAPLAGALLFIARTGNVVLGGAALFLLALGLGVPLLVIGTSAGHFLPRAGRWMDVVKAVFGVVLLGVAIWFLSRILPGPASLTLWAILAIVSAVYLGAFRSAAVRDSGWGRLWQGIGLALFAYGLAMGAGALAGGRLVLEPLAPFVVHGEAIGVQPTKTANQRFKRHMVTSLTQLHQALLAAKGHPVLVDFWAKWCVECQRMDVETYGNPLVDQTTRSLVLIRVNVTASDSASRALLHHFQLFGPPATLLVSASGRTVAKYEGYEGPQTLLQHVQQKLGIDRSNR
ncbi:protein-disulfide reductase DsbD [Acidithiobacillus caldus]|uniref:protein-disulfide reductase DsbD n=1 Tax=Acidithiobacillus caldus TaxID=33059 RepID=UPI001C068EF7|nr:protein-disulfide reductase DsbD [Acidithiobacillus caldus]MBU2764433.1 protein-disulfide reductase DsbD [Acidithiobacillus caldus]